MRFGTVADRLVLVRGGRVLDVQVASAGRFSADVLEGLSRWAELRAWADSADFSAGVTNQAADFSAGVTDPAADFSAAVTDPAADLPAAVTDPAAVGVANPVFGPPVPRPRQVFAIALNYRPHAAEAGFAAPDAPLVFTKFPSCITGPDVTVNLPAGKVDWEIEIVAVIGTGGFQIPRGQGWAAVAGLTIGQDLSERVMQMSGHPAQFSLGKSYPGFGPIGPVVVSAEEFADADDVPFESTLDGDVMQYGRTSEMIFSVDELVHRLSAVCQLYPGDLIFTGTPAGVGNRMDPPRYLQPGQTLVSRVPQIGEIRQRFV